MRLKDAFPLLCLDQKQHVLKRCPWGIYSVKCISEAHSCNLKKLRSVMPSTGIPIPMLRSTMTMRRFSALLASDVRTGEML